MKNPKPQEWRSSELSQCYIADYKPFNFVDGQGVRNALYVSGCLFSCEGCYNAAVQSFYYGVPYTEKLEQQILEDTAKEYVQGITLLGGEPFLNTEVCLSLVKKCRKRFGKTKDIWAWTGYTWEELLQETPDKLALLEFVDILVDGRFELAKKNLHLQFRGSSNQRIIDVEQSLQKKEVILWEELQDEETKVEQINRAETE